MVEIPLQVWRSSPSPCPYLSGHQQILHCELYPSANAETVERLLDDGFRRHSVVFYKPVCNGCSECISLRIRVADFKPNRTQRRVWKKGEGIRFVVGAPKIDRERLMLYHRFHIHGELTKGWHEHEGDAENYWNTFVRSPNPVEEWSYWLEDELVGLGFVDVGMSLLSAVYFMHDPKFADYSPGVFNILKLVEEAKRRGFPTVHLGYAVRDCPSLNYKFGYDALDQLRRDDADWNAI